MSAKQRGEYPDNWKELAREVKCDALYRCIRCNHPHNVAENYVLTVHHWDGNKSNNRWWNLMALCQRCHLKIQNQVDPGQTYLWEHTPWCQPYAAGLYAFKYLGEELSREAAMERLPELLALEGVA